MAFFAISFILSMSTKIVGVFNVEFDNLMKISLSFLAEESDL